MDPILEFREHINVSIANLVLIFFTVFICPLFPAEALIYIYPLCFCGIFLLVSMSMVTNMKFNLVTSGILIVLIWTGIFSGNEVLRGISRVLQFVFFIYLLILKVSIIAGSTSVKKQLIIDSVTAYFLLGLAFSTIVTFLASVIPGAYNIQYSNVVHRFEPIREYFYYSFVTFTSTGYGDIIPMRQESKSLAVLIAVSGQLYVAIIIAMLVGKYSQSSKTST
jgi:voltage-gated potassium channel